MIKIGKFNQLEILRETSVGLYLGSEDGIDILLPNKYVPSSFEIGDMIEVFVYRDSEDRLIATDINPKIIVGEFARLQVKDTNDFGAFLDWGLEKDLMVPFKEQQRKMEEGSWHTVFAFIDELTGRVVASSRINPFLSNEVLEVEEGDEVDVLINNQTELGFNVIINDRHLGLLYENEIFKKIHQGERVKGFIKKIRFDNKIDISLQKQGYENVEPNAEIILNLLQANEGFLPYTDKSDPEEIKSYFEMSKKTFKKAIGGLYREKIIAIEDAGIRLV